LIGDQRARKRLALRRAKNGDREILFKLHYTPVDGYEPESMLIEKDLLAPMFDSAVEPVYTVVTGQIRGRFAGALGFEDALNRYLELVRNFKATEDYIHPEIFRWHRKWVEGKDGGQ
jgi:hypothetical protein